MRMSQIKSDVRTFVVSARAKAFTGEPVRMNKFFVELDGTVRVWDEVGQIFTVCHALSVAAQRRIAKLAKAQYPEFYSA